MYAAYPKAPTRWENNHVNLDDSLFPNECLALNLSFPKLLFLDGIFKGIMVRRRFQYLIRCAAERIEEGSETGYLRLWYLENAINISVFEGFP